MSVWAQMQEAAVRVGNMLNDAGVPLYDDLGAPLGFPLRVGVVIAERDDAVARAERAETALAGVQRWMASPQDQTARLAGIGRALQQAQDQERGA